MKKFLNTILIMVCVIMSGLLFTACGSNNTTCVFLSFEQDGVGFYQTSYNETSKSFVYELSTTYGTTIDFDNFTLTCRKEKDGDININKKTGNTNGYTLVDEDNLFASSEQNAGTYTLIFKYEGWTTTVDVTIEKQIVDIPYLENMFGDYQVPYDGQDYTSRIIYNEDASRMVTPFVERKDVTTIPPNDVYVNHYRVEFALKSDNYKWSISENALEPNGNYIFIFAISNVD